MFKVLVTLYRAGDPVLYLTSVDPVKYLLNKWRKMINANCFVCLKILLED